MPPPTLLEPLRFERILLPKVWGGRALERVLGIALPAAERVGETWEISDRPGHNSVVAQGAERGTNLRDLMRLHGEDLLGSSRPAADGAFPLLIKFLDASEPLSLQVHPHARTCRAGEQQKNECWYVLDAQPGARIWLDLVPGTTRETLAAHAARASITDLVRQWPVHAGDFVLVPAGTVHALGGGITLVEIQENADVTHRLYDWDRPGSDGKPRALQVEDALRSVRYDAAPAEGPRTPALREIAPGLRQAELCRTHEFAVELWESSGALEFDSAGRAEVLIVLEGAGRIQSEHCDRELARGESWLVPAALGRHRIQSTRPLKLLLVKAP